MGVWEQCIPVKREGSESAFKWSNGLWRSLHRLSQGPLVSDVHSGDTLAEFISQVADQDTDPQTGDGVAYYFDARVDPADKQAFFEKTLPRMAGLALRLPELLAEQSEQSTHMAGKLSEEIKSFGAGDDDGSLSPLSLQVNHGPSSHISENSCQPIRV
jgi:hypothetical protein